MKNSLLILLAFPVLLFTSCSSNDDSAPPIETTNLYGTWDLDYYVQNGSVTENIDCSDKIIYEFTNTRTYTKTTFAEGSANCVEAVIVKGTWENLGENQFKLTPNGSNTNQTLDITFQDINKKISIKYSSTYKEVYRKEIR
jgi:hypothetical protein